MQHAFKFKVLPFILAGFAILAGCVAAPPPQHHPAYLHSLSDLRAARWLIEHHPGDWAQTADEAEAVHKIDAAINDIKKAAIDDGKNLNDRPPTDTHPDNRGRIHEALRYLNKEGAERAR